MEPLRPDDDPVLFGDSLQELLSRKADAIVHRVMWWTMTGGSIGTLSGGLLGLVLAVFGRKLLGPAGEIIGGLGAGVMTVLLLTAKQESIWHRATWIGVGAMMWAVIWLVGSTFWRWQIGQTLFVWLMGGTIIAMLGCTRCMALQGFLDKDYDIREEARGDAIYPYFVVWVIWMAVRLIPGRTLRGAVGGGIGGALGGAFGGGVFGAFSGPTGMETIQGAVGGAIGGAVVAGLGGLVGGATVIRRSCTAPDLYGKHPSSEQVGLLRR